jgi:hypothetical protein
MGEPEGRPLTNAEEAILDLLVAPDFPGFEVLREQAKTARVIGGCECGCPSIDIDVDRANTPPAPITSDGSPIVVADAHDQDPGRFCEVMLWLTSDGYLHGVELWWLDTMPDVFPPPEMFDPSVVVSHGP